MGKGRLEAFSDGVIAIIITIMVLELKVPHGAEFSALQELLRKYEVEEALLWLVDAGVTRREHLSDLSEQDVQDMGLGRVARRRFERMLAEAGGTAAAREGAGAGAGDAGAGADEAGGASADVSQGGGTLPTAAHRQWGRSPMSD